MSHTNPSYLASARILARTALCAALPLVPLAACSSSPDAPGARLSITAAALTLDPVGEATYGITVRNSDPAPDNIVWSKSGLGSLQYGNASGSMSYVGTCDATANPHQVELVLESLAKPGGGTIDPASYQNPAPAGRPLVLLAECSENADTPVVFNLVIMRSAEQGFFDIVVNFEDIFCSAKVDCVDELLHDDEGERGPTVVMGFACTAGSTANGEAEPTWLHMTDVRMECDGEPTLWFDPSGPRGNNGPLGTTPSFTATAIYRGQESLPNVDKCYWNAAFGVNAAGAANCHIRAQATATHASLGPTGATPANTTSPYVAIDVQVTGPTGALVCDNNGLDDPESGVTTQYTSLAGATFTHEWECDPSTDPVDVAKTCTGTFEGSRTMAIKPTPEGVSIEMSGVRSASYTLREGAFIGGDSTCCVNPCCSN